MASRLSDTDQRAIALHCERSGVLRSSIKSRLSNGSANIMPPLNNDSKRTPPPQLDDEIMTLELHA